MKGTKVHLIEITEMGMARERSDDEHADNVMRVCKSIEAALNAETAKGATIGEHMDALASMLSSVLAILLSDPESVEQRDQDIANATELLAGILSRALTDTRAVQKNSP